MKSKEAIIHMQICTYIRTQYPDVIFTTEASGLRLTIGQAKKMKGFRSGSGLPDLWIMEPKANYHGLFIELKADGEKLTKKNGDWINEHIKEQSLVINRLNIKGYRASFQRGFDNAKSEIYWYMNLK